MQQTTNYNLNKPEGADYIDIGDLNHNADVIDMELNKLSDKLNALNTNDKEAREAINSLKLELEEKELVDFIDNNTGVGYYDTFVSNEGIDVGSTTANINNVLGEITFTTGQTLDLLEQQFNSITNIELNIYDKTINNIEVVENSNLSTVKVLLVPDSKSIGDKIFYGGEEYTIQNIEQVI